MQGPIRQTYLLRRKEHEGRGLLFVGDVFVGLLFFFNNVVKVMTTMFFFNCIESDIKNTYK